MRSPLVRVALFVAIAVSGVAIASKIDYQEPKYEDKDGLTITPQKLVVDDDRLVLHMIFWNKTDKPMVVDRDKLMLKLPDGRMIERYKGMMVGWGMAGATHDIPAHGSHEVHIEFVVGSAPPSAQLLLDKAIVSEGKMLSFPPYHVVRK